MTLAFIVANEMSARMAVATGKGLADLIRENFGVKITFYLMMILFLTNLACIVAEFAGVAASIEIFHMSQPIWARLLGVSVPTVRAWEQGQNEPAGPVRRLLQVLLKHPEQSIKDIVNDKNQKRLKVG